MYLDSLSLTNFKCFTHYDLALKPITVLLGANSTGKSTLLYGILAALQSQNFPLNLSPNGNLVNLGDFRAFSHNHRTDHEIGLALKFSGHNLGSVTLSGRYNYSPNTRMPELVSAHLSSPVLNLEASKERQYKIAWAYDNVHDSFHRSFRESEALASILRDYLSGTAKDATSKSDPQRRVRTESVAAD